MSQLCIAFRPCTFYDTSGAPQHRYRRAEAGVQLISFACASIGRQDVEPQSGGSQREASSPAEAKEDQAVQREVSDRDSVQPFAVGESHHIL